MAATGAVTALVGCLLPTFVSLRPNRLVTGHAVSLSSAAGPWALPLLALAGLVTVAAVVPLRRRGAVLRVAGVAIVAVLAWALGAACSRLLPGAGEFARVSLGVGAWLVALGGLVAAFAGARAPGGLPRWSMRAVDLAALAVAVAAVPLGGLARLSLAQEYEVQSDAFWTAVAQHLALAGAGVALGALIGVPLGVLAFRSAPVRRVALGIVGVIQTVPSLALLGLLVAPLAALRAASPLLAALGVSGIGATPAVIALTLYALLPIVRNTYVGLAEVDPAAVDAGRGMGMGRGQLLLRVEFPLALPLLLEGLRTAAVLVLGIATVTAFVGAGGLGVLVFTGLGQQADDLVLLGAVPVIVLAVAADTGMRGLSRVVVSPGIRGTA